VLFCSWLFCVDSAALGVGRENGVAEPCYLQQSLWHVHHEQLITTTANVLQAETKLPIQNHTAQRLVQRIEYS
jgi:hypothetical protein